MKILIVEDESSIQKLLKYDLENAGYQVEQAIEGNAGYEMASVGKYDVILLDLMLPNMNGLDICRKLRDKNIKSYIIMLTALADEFNILEGFDAGCNDYLTKPFSPRELIARIKAGTKNRTNEKSQKEEIILYNGLKIVPKKYEIYNNDEKLDVTLREYEILKYLLDNKGNALSRDQLLCELWGYSYDGDTRVVDVHIFKLRDKLKDKGNMIKTIRGIGYMVE